MGKIGLRAAACDENYEVKNMLRKTKKITSVLLSLAMLLGTLPALALPAYAAEEPSQLLAPELGGAPGTLSKTASGIGKSAYAASAGEHSVLPMREIGADKVVSALEEPPDGAAGIVRRSHADMGAQNSTAEPAATPGSQPTVMATAAASADLVCMIGTEGYISLEAALDYVRNNDTIVMMANDSMGRLDVYHEKFTIDTNGHNITFTYGVDLLDCQLAIIGPGTVTFVNWGLRMNDSSLTISGTNISMLNHGVEMYNSSLTIIEEAAFRINGFIRVDKNSSAHVTRVASLYEDYCVVVVDGSNLTVDESVTGIGTGVYAEGKGSSAKVLSATATGLGSLGVGATDGASVTVLHSAYGDDTGVSAEQGASVVVNGNATGNYAGAHAYDKGKVTVVGTVQGGTFGAEAAWGGSVGVEGGAIGGTAGAIAEGMSAKVTVNGQIIGADLDSFGAMAIDGGKVTGRMGAFGGKCGAYAEGSVYNTQTATHTPSSVNITGDAVATMADDEEAIGAFAVDFGSVTVTGDAEGTGIGAVALDAGAITVKGHAIGVSIGVHAEGDDASITVQGDVYASGAVDAFAVQCIDGASVAIGGSAYSGDGGVFVQYGSEVTIEGSIFPANLARTIALEGWTVSVDDFATPTTKTGYTTYTKTYYYNDLHMEYTSNLWVRSGSSGLPFSIDIGEIVFPAGAASASGEDNYIFIVGSGLYALYDYALSLDGGATKFGELYSAIGVFNGNGVIITFDLPPNTGGSDITRTISLFVNGADTGSSLTIVQRGTDYEDVMNSAANLTWFAICGLNTSPDNVMDPLILPTEWDFGTQIAWESQNPAVVVEDDETGSINFVEDPVNDFTEGDVVATITKGGASATVAFSIAVPTLTPFTVGTGGAFATLDQALASMVNNIYYSIKLLENITCDTPVTISLKNIVFDLNGHDLVFGAGLTLRGSRVSYAHGGHLIVRQDLALLTTSVGSGPNMTTYESRGDFSSFESTGKGNIGLNGLCNRATIGDVTMNGGGCIELSASVLTVTGNIYIENNAGDVALYAGSNGKLEVHGTMTVTEGWVAEFTDGGQMVAHKALIFNHDTFFRDANVGTKKVEYTYSDVSVGYIAGYPAYFFYGPKSWPFAIVMNIGPFLAVSDMAGVPAIATVYVPLALDYTVTPALATYTGATWVVKSPGTTDAVITSGAYDGDWALLSTLPGTVTLTATIKNGLAPGTDFVKDFVVQIFPEIVSIEVRTPPDKLTYFLGEALDLTGMEVYAQYYDNSERLVTEYETSPKQGDKFNQLGTIEVEVTYDKEWSFWNRPVAAFDVEVVLEPDVPGVCQIVETGKSYEHFEDALAAHESGQTIRLLTDIHYYKGILLEGEVLNLDLNGHDMIVEVAYITYDDWFGIAAYEGGQLNLVGTGGGKLNVLAGDTGIYANGISSSVTVDSITALGNYGSSGVAVNYDGSATARGNIAGYDYGIYVLNGGKVSAKGNVAAKNYGVYAEGRGSVAGGSLGEIDVSGSIAAVNYGVYADLQGADRAVVHAGGDVKPLTTNLTYGIYQDNGAKGNFVATVDGSISADWTAVETCGGTIDVVGGAISKGSGVMANDGAQVTLGSLTANEYYSYINTSYNSVYSWFNKEEFITPTTKEGFLTYTDGVNSVWVMVPGAFIPVTSITGVPDTAEAGSPLALTGKVESAFATNRTIVWSIKDAGSTGAVLSGNVLLAPSAGTVVVTATVADGAAIGTAYTQDFAIVIGDEGTVAVLESIAVTAPPDKLVYTVGENLDVTGLQVTAYYSDGSSKAVTGYNTDPASGAPLYKSGPQTVTVSYTEDGAAKTASFDATVNLPEFEGELVEIIDNATDAVFIINAVFDDLYEVTIIIDGVSYELRLVKDGDKYLLYSDDLNGVDPVGEAESGSIVITLYKGFLDALNNGSYALRVSLLAEGETVPYAEPETAFKINRPDDGTPILYEVHNAEELNGVFSMDDEWGYYLDNEKTIWYGFYDYVAEHSLNWSKPMPDNYPCIVKLMDDIVFFDDYYDDVLGLVHYDGEVPQPAVTDKLVTIDLNGHHMDLAGMYVHNSKVNVEGDIYIIWSPGIWMSDACDFVVNGSIYGSGTNLEMLCSIGTGCSVAVKGDVVSNGEGIRVDGNNATVTVNGSITAETSAIVTNGGNDTVIVLGDATGSTVIGGYGSAATVVVHGDVTGQTGVFVWDEKSSVTVYGNVTGAAETDGVTWGEGIQMNGGEVTVGGNVHGGSTGINATGISSVTVSGNLTSGGAYITLSSDSGGSKTFAKEDKSPASSKPGYDEYAFEDAIVWVKSSLSEAALTGIAVTSPPAKTEYFVGDTLDLAGLAVTATYSDDTAKAVTGYTTDPANGAVLNTAGIHAVTVSYTEGGVTRTASFDVTVEPATIPFVPVTDITGVPAAATAGTPLALAGTVVPTNATNQNIVWTVKDAGATGATIFGNALNAATAGTAIVTATVVDGLTVSSNFTKDFAISVNEPVLGKAIKASVRTNPASYLGEDVEFTLSLSDAENVLDIKLTFEIDGSMIAWKSIETLAGFDNVGGIYWTLVGSNTWKGTVTIGIPSSDGIGFTSEAPVDIAKFTFASVNAGNANLTLTGFTVVAYVGDTTQYVESIIEAGTATTKIDKHYSKYDLNKDGIIDALDLGIMLLYCGFNADSADWASLVKVNDSQGIGVTASMCDVNGDGIIDMLDLLDLFIHYTK